MNDEHLPHIVERNLLVNISSLFMGIFIVLTISSLIAYLYEMKTEAIGLMISSQIFFLMSLLCIWISIKFFGGFPSGPIYCSECDLSCKFHKGCMGCMAEEPHILIFTPTINGIKITDHKKLESMGYELKLNHTGYTWKKAGDEDEF